jgi:hypothetical protein
MRFAVAALSCFIATLGFAAADDSPGALQALLARVSAATGPAFDTHLRGSAVAGPDRTVIESQGPRSLVRRCQRQFCSGVYLDGETVWQFDLNDTAVPYESEDPRRVTVRAIESAAFAAPGFASAGGRLSAKASLQLADGRTVQRVAVTAPQGATLDALIDPRSALVQGVRGQDVEIDYADFRKVGDLMLPYEVTSGTSVLRFDERSVETAPLSAPRGLVPAIAGGRSVVPFVDTDRPAVDPIVECSLGGERVPCLFDTGNSGVSISLELAERLHLEPLPGSMQIRGLGAYETGLVKGPELHVGDAIYPPAYYAVLHDMHAYGYDLVLGADVFAHALVTIDYAARKLTLEPEAKAAQTGGLAIAFEDFLPVAKVKLGSLEVRLAIDTGDESSFNIAQDLYARHPEIFAAQSSARVAGIGGTGEELQGTIPRAEFGGYTLLNQQIGATNRVLPAAQGHLGSGALAHFSVTFDYAHRRVGLVPRRGDAAVVSSSPGQP